MGAHRKNEPLLNEERWFEEQSGLAADVQLALTGAEPEDENKDKHYYDHEKQWTQNHYFYKAPKEDVAWRSRVDY